MNDFKTKVINIQYAFKNWPKAKKIVFVSLLSCIGAILQSAGGYLPGVGYAISPLATAPVILCTLFSIPFGLYSYTLIALLLFILQPSELIIFPFTTGLLGLFIGISLQLFRKKWSHVLSGATGLVIGICIVLYGLQFPVLGPAIPHTVSLPIVGMIISFSIFYSWIWVVIVYRLIHRITRIIFSSPSK